MKSLMILLDTNIIIDIMLNREGCDFAETILEASIDHDYIECVTATTVTDINYVVDKSLKDISSLETQKQLKDMLTLVSVLPVTGDNVFDAFSLKWKDYEDALQYCIAKANLCDCIVTNNVKDFETDDIDILSPEDFIKKYLNVKNMSDDSSPGES